MVCTRRDKGREGGPRGEALKAFVLLVAVAGVKNATPTYGPKPCKLPISFQFNLVGISSPILIRMNRLAAISL